MMQDSISAPQVGGILSLTKSILKMTAKYKGFSKGIKKTYLSQQ